MEARETRNYQPRRSAHGPTTKITQKHYKHWSKAAEKLEEAVKIHGHKWPQWRGQRLKNRRNVLKTNERRMVEAGGVEPPSEKRYATEPTCLSQFAQFRKPRLERARNAAG